MGTLSWYRSPRKDSITHHYLPAPFPGERGQLGALSRATSSVGQSSVPSEASIHSQHVSPPGECDGSIGPHVPFNAKPLLG